MRSFHIGFTGTRTGMTDKQKSYLQEFLKSIIAVCQFHHGSCIGADKEASDIAVILGMEIIVHPPLDKKNMAPCTGKEVREPKSYGIRDRDIVDESDWLIATPKGFNEELRSGTWQTVRYARKVNRKTMIIYPDGTTVIENDKLSW